MEEDKRNWWKVFTQLQALLREGAKAGHKKGQLSDAQIEKYFISGNPLKVQF